ncbi:MAG: hypothetical protein ABIN89_07410 [Chitinophagaceae bacterium]
MNIKLLDNKTLKEFSAGPGIESFEDHLYVVSDDTRCILVMNRSWKIQETINVFASDTFRIAKDSTLDFEATTIVQINKIPFILMIGSGSMEASGHNAVLMNLHTRAVEEIDLSVFYNRLKQSGFEELDIAAVTVMDDKLILCNRANKTHADNRVIITSIDFWKNQHLADILTVKIELEEKPGKILSLTGITYSYENDWLIASVSSEDSNNTIDERTLGDSYIGVIENASRKIGRKRFKINEYLNLSEVDKKFKGQQIKAVCIQADKEQRLKLHLVGGNDKGESSLFKVRLKE